MTSKEQAERFVFANNMRQSNLFSAFNLYSVPVIGLAVAALGFLIGRAEGELTGEVLAFAQAAFALGGLAFAMWNSETQRNRVANTYLIQFGVLFEIAVLVIGLVMIALHLVSPGIPALAYMVPWAVFGVVFFASCQVLRARAGAHERKVGKTTSFATLIVVVIVGMLVGKAVTAGTSGLFGAAGGAGQGIAVLGVGSLLALILGLLAAVAFFKNLLVKRFDIDLSRLYTED
jgi:hypothetical protein